jgi:hypothetical protein
MPKNKKTRISNAQVQPSSEGFSAGLGLSSGIGNSQVNGFASENFKNIGLQHTYPVNNFMDISGGANYSNFNYPNYKANNLSGNIGMNYSRPVSKNTDIDLTASLDLNKEGMSPGFSMGLVRRFPHGGPFDIHPEPYVPAAESTGVQMPNMLQPMGQDEAARFYAEQQAKAEQERQAQAQQAQAEAQKQAEAEAQRKQFENNPYATAPSYTAQPSTTATTPPAIQQTQAQADEEERQYFYNEFKKRTGLDKPIDDPYVVSKMQQYKDEIKKEEERVASGNLTRQEYFDKKAREAGPGLQSYGKAPARYMLKNPLMILGDAFNPMMPGSGIFPDSKQDVYRDNYQAMYDPNQEGYTDENGNYRLFYDVNQKSQGQRQDFVQEQAKIEEERNQALSGEKSQEQSDIALGAAIELGTFGLGHGYNALRKIGKTAKGKFQQDLTQDAINAGDHFTRQRAIGKQVRGEIEKKANLPVGGQKFASKSNVSNAAPNVEIINDNGILREIPLGKKVNSAGPGGEYKSFSDMTLGEKTARAFLYKDAKTPAKELAEIGHQNATKRQWIKADDVNVDTYLTPKELYRLSHQMDNREYNALLKKYEQYKVDNPFYASGAEAVDGVTPHYSINRVADEARFFDGAGDNSFETLSGIQSEQMMFREGRFADLTENEAEAIYRNMAAYERTLNSGGIRRSTADIPSTYMERYNQNVNDVYNVRRAATPQATEPVSTIDNLNPPTSTTTSGLPDPGHQPGTLAYQDPVNGNEGYFGIRQADGSVEIVGNGNLDEATEAVDRLNGLTVDQTQTTAARQVQPTPEPTPAPAPTPRAPEPAPPNSSGIPPRPRNVRIRGTHNPSRAAGANMPGPGANPQIKNSLIDKKYRSGITADELAHSPTTNRVADPGGMTTNEHVPKSSVKRLEDENAFDVLRSARGATSPEDWEKMHKSRKQIETKATLFDRNGNSTNGTVNYKRNLDNADVEKNIKEGKITPIQEGEEMNIDTRAGTSVYMKTWTDNWGGGETYHYLGAFGGGPSSAAHAAYQECRRHLPVGGTILEQVSLSNDSFRNIVSELQRQKKNINRLVKKGDPESLAKAKLGPEVEPAFLPEQKKTRYVNKEVEKTRQVRNADGEFVEEKYMATERVPEEYQAPHARHWLHMNSMAQKNKWPASQKTQLTGNASSWVSKEEAEANAKALNEYMEGLGLPEAHIKKVNDGDIKVSRAEFERLKAETDPADFKPFKYEVIEDLPAEFVGTKEEYHLMLPNRGLKRLRALLGLGLGEEALRQGVSGSDTGPQQQSFGGPITTYARGGFIPTMGYGGPLINYGNGGTLMPYMYPQQMKGGGQFWSKFGAGATGALQGVAGSLLPGQIGNMAVKGIGAIHGMIDRDVTDADRAIMGGARAVGAGVTAVATGGASLAAGADDMVLGTKDAIKSGTEWGKNNAGALDAVGSIAGTVAGGAAGGAAGGNGIQGALKGAGKSLGMPGQSGSGSTFTGGTAGNAGAFTGQQNMNGSNNNINMDNIMGMFAGQGQPGMGGGTQQGGMQGGINPQQIMQFAQMFGKQAYGGPVQMAQGGFKPHPMYKDDQMVMANNNDTHLRLKEQGYGHEQMEQGGLMSIDNGGTHEQNPMGGVPVGPKALVEEGETIMNMPTSNLEEEVTGGKFVFSNRRGPKGKKGSTWADLSKRVESKYKDREGDPVSDRAKNQELFVIAEKQEAQKAKEVEGLKKQITDIDPTALPTLPPGMAAGAPQGPQGMGQGMPQMPGQTPANLPPMPAANGGMYYGNGGALYNMGGMVTGQQMMDPNMMQQPQMGGQPMHQMPDGSMMPGASHEEAMQMGMYGNGGPYYNDGGPIMYAPGGKIKYPTGGWAGMFNHGQSFDLAGMKKYAADNNLNWNDMAGEAQKAGLSLGDTGGAGSTNQASFGPKTLAAINALQGNKAAAAGSGNQSGFTPPAQVAGLPAVQGGNTNWQNQVYGQSQGQSPQQFNNMINQAQGKQPGTGTGDGDGSGTPFTGGQPYKAPYGSVFGGQALNSLGDLNSVYQGMFNKGDVPELGRMNPKHIDLHSQRQALNKQAGNSFETVKQGMRKAGDISSLVTANAALDENLGQGVAKSYSDEFNFNNMLDNKAEEYNIGKGDTEQMLAIQRDEAAKQQVNQGLHGIGQNFGQGMKDIRDHKAVDTRNKMQLAGINATSENFNWDQYGELLNFVGA